MTATSDQPSLETLAHALLDAARKAGADAADVLVMDGRSISARRSR